MQNGFPQSVSCYLTFTMTVHQIKQQTPRWAEVTRLAIFWEKYVNQDYTMKLLKQDFLHLDISNGRKTFTSQINCLIRSSAFFLEN